MAILGGSPLGLIGVRSTPTRDGMSTFNAGKSRNVNVFYYNAGKEANPDAQPRYDKWVQKYGGMYSLFSHKGIIKPWPNIAKIGTDSDTSGLKDTASDKKRRYKSIARNRLHNNEVYDTSLLNIIEKLSGTPAAVRPQDFAYLKDVGVFPNNRLMIARRFSGPVGDNIYRKSKKGGRQRPLALLVSWKPQDEDFLEIDFGEKWDDSKADFTSVLTAVGEDFMGGGLGAKVGGAGGALPLPGFTEHLQRYVLAELGVFDKDAPQNDLPAGDPNLIKIAKKRKTVPYGEAGSGLSCTISIKMTCEYEQKFISGIDPTVMWQDLLSNILRFGSSNSSDYGLSAGASQKLIGWVNNPKKLIKDLADAIKEGVKASVGFIRDLLTKQYDDKLAAAEAAGTADLTDEDLDEEEDEDAEDLTQREKIQKERDAEIKLFDGLTKGIIELGTEAIAKTIGKYKEEVKGIVFALSGLPSTPWHITIGNPLRPVFSSGDMWTDNVKLTLGPDLAFNDLPSRITVDFTLKNARPLGIQEIMKKFNTGYIRTIDPAADWSGNKPSQSPGDPAYSGTTETDEIENQTGNGTSTVSNTNAGANNTNTVKTTENGSQEVINPDANSSTTVIEEGNTTT